MSLLFHQSFAEVLEPKGWKEIRISGDLLIKFFPRKGVRRGVFAESPCDQKSITNYIDGHNIDFVKDRIAVDIEWNSKDQTFDRDLFAMRTYYECDIISVGIIITRSESLNEIFKKLGIMTNHETVEKHCSLHNPDSPLLFGEVAPDDKITVRKMASVIDKQQEFLW